MSLFAVLKLKGKMASAASSSEDSKSIGKPESTSKTMEGSSTMKTVADGNDGGGGGENSTVTADLQTSSSGNNFAGLTTVANFARRFRERKLRSLTESKDKKMAAEPSSDDEKSSPPILVIEEKPQLPQFSPDQIAMVLAAKQQDWNKVELELKKFHKGDRRLNQAEPINGETTLMEAVKFSRYLLVAKLCDMGALVNFRCNDRRTALHFAVAEGHEEIVKLLLTKNADPNLIGGPLMQLPIHISAARSSKALVSAQFILRAMLKKGRLLKDALGNIPIAYAVQAGCVTLVKEMLQILAKEQVSWRNDTTGDYLVHIAARNGDVACLSALVVQAKADVNVRNNDGQTPLHICCKAGDEVMVKLLNSFKANPDVIDKKERTSVSIFHANFHHSFFIFQ